MTTPLASHGTIVSRAPAATPTAFTAIAELGDVTPPDEMRNEFDASSQDRNVDSYVLGILRRGPLTIPLHFIPSNATHDHLTGLQKALHTDPVPIDGWKIAFPDGTTVIHSGQVQHLAYKAPVDGMLAVDLTVRMSGAFLINGVVVGA